MGVILLCYQRISEPEYLVKMSETVLALSAFLISIAALIVSILSAVYTRRQAVVMEKQYENEKQRQNIRVELIEVKRSDALDSFEVEFAYPEYFVLKFIINNPSDEPKLLKDILLCCVLRDANFLSYIWTRYNEWENKRHNKPIDLELIADSFPYMNGFLGKIDVRLLDTSTGDLIRLKQSLRVNAKDKLWIEILLRITDEWLQELKVRKKVLRYLSTNFIFDNQTEVIAINVNDYFLGSVHYSGIGEAEAGKFSRFM